MNKEQDDLIIEGEGNGLAPIGDGKILFRVLAEENNLNIDARESLLEFINKRMAATNHTLIWKLKYALDKAEFARNHVLTQDLAEVEKFLSDAARLTRVAIADFQRDAEAYRTLAGLAKQVKESEGKQ